SLVMGAFLELLEKLEYGFAPRAALPVVPRTALRDHQQILRAVRSGDGQRVEELAFAHLRRLERRFADIEAQRRRAQAADVQVIPAWGAPDADGASVDRAEDNTGATTLTAVRRRPLLSKRRLERELSR